MAEETSSPRNTMSLVPYFPEQSREIVLRHASIVVVYDQRSKQLSLRDASHSDDLAYTSCPTCHRPFEDANDTHHERSDGPPSADESHWMDPSYFRMLRHSAPTSSAGSPPPSPRRRLAQPVRHVSAASLHAPAGAEFIGSGPQAPSRASGISSSAFSQGYFKTFFVEEGELGRGGKGVVLLVRHMLDGVPLGHFACKRVPVGDDHTWLEKVLVEVQLLQDLSHQNLVSYRHVWLEDYRITNFGPSVPCAFILQQYCNGGDLHNYVLESARVSLSTEQLKERMRRRSKGRPEGPEALHEPRRMHFEEIFSFFKDITSGLHHLHSHGYIHRDLKPQNCLLHNTGIDIRVLVSDFGEVQVENVARKSTGATGTISYCAPEVLSRQTPGDSFGNFTTKSDVFSLGMIVYFMCFGRLPYSTADVDEEKEDLDELRAEISSWAGFDEDNRVRADLPVKLYRFLKRLLSLNPNDRPSTEEILQGIRTGTSLDDLAPHPPNLLDDLRHRISSVEASPSPTPRRVASGAGIGKSALRGYGTSGPSKLRPSSSEKAMNPPRSPSSYSPPSNENTIAGTNSSHNEESNTNSTLRARRKSESERPTAQQRTSSLTRLALPPPPSPILPSLPTSLLPPLPTIPILQTLQTTNSTTWTHEFFTLWRIAAFCLKYYTLSRQCYPRVAEPAYVVYPLMLLAALDFMPSRSRAGRSFVLVLLHFFVVGLAGWAGLLCPHDGRGWVG